MFQLETTFLSATHIFQNDHLLAGLAVLLMDGVDVMRLLTSVIASLYNRVTCGFNLILLN